MCDLVRVHVIISFGDCSVSFLCPMYWVAPHRSAGVQQDVTSFRYYCEVQMFLYLEQPGIDVPNLTTIVVL